MAYKVYHKKNLFLKEDVKTAAVTGVTGPENLTSGIEKTIQQNNTAKDFVVPGAVTDSNTGNNPFEANINANTSSEAAQKMVQTSKSPQVKKIGADNVNYHVQLNNSYERLGSLIENSVRFTKSEINKLFIK